MADADDGGVSGVFDDLSSLNALVFHVQCASHHANQLQRLGILVKRLWTENLALKKEVATYKQLFTQYAITQPTHNSNSSAATATPSLPAPLPQTQHTGAHSVAFIQPNSTKDTQLEVNGVGKPLHKSAANPPSTHGTTPAPPTAELLSTQQQQQLSANSCNTSNAPNKSNMSANRPGSDGHGFGVLSSAASEAAVIDTFAQPLALTLQLPLKPSVNHVDSLLTAAKTRDQNISTSLDALSLELLEEECRTQSNSSDSNSHLRSSEILPPPADAPNPNPDTGLYSSSIFLSNRAPLPTHAPTYAFLSSLLESNSSNNAAQPNPSFSSAAASSFSSSQRHSILSSGRSSSPSVSVNARTNENSRTRLLHSFDVEDQS